MINESFYKGFYGLERETLRIDCYRRLASTPHPFNDNDNITKDYCENQLEIAVRFSQIIRAFAEMIILWTICGLLRQKNRLFYDLSRKGAIKKTP